MWAWLSWGLTPVVFFGCILVILHYAPAIWRRPFREMQPYDWLILGIVIGFTGSFINNLYWAGGWTTHMLGGDIGWWIDNGPAANIVFRQIPIIVAAACHIYAAKKAHRSIGWIAITCAGLLSILLTLISLLMVRVTQ